MLSVTPEQFEECLELTATSSKGLVNVCKQLGVSYKAMRCYIDQNDDTRAKYARSKQDQADFIADEMIDIADDNSNDDIVLEDGTVKEHKEWVNRSRVRVDTRKWIASKLKPKTYGDKLDITSDNQAIVRNITLTSIPSKSNSDIQLNNIDNS